MKNTITAIEAALLASVLRPRIQALTDLRAAQVELLPPGDSGWFDTEEQLAVANGALAKIEAM
jgi:hypothetical protein